MSQPIPPRRSADEFPTYRDLPSQHDLPKQARKSSAWPLIIVLSVAGLVVLVLGVGIWYGVRGEGLFGGGTIDPQDAEWAAILPADEHCAQIAAAFRADKDNAGAAERRGIERLLDALVRATSGGDERKFHVLLDFDRLYEQVLMYPFANFDWYERQQISRSLRDEIVAPLACERYSIAHVDLSPSSNEALVDVYLWDEYGTLYEYRLWTIRHGRRWKIYDWEEIAKGRRETRDWALAYSHYDEIGWDAYIAAMDDITEAAMSYDDEEVSTALRRAESRAVTRDVADLKEIEIAYSWQLHENYRAAIAAAERVDSPCAAPGTYYIRALAYQALGQHEDAVDMIERFEQLVGAKLAGCLVRAEALTAAGEYAQAAEQWKQYLQQQPNDFAALESLGHLLDDDAKGEMLARVQQCRDPAHMAHLLAQTFRYTDANLAAAMLGYLQEREPDSSRVLALQAQIAEAEDRIDEAATLYRRAIDNESDNETRDELISSLAEMLMWNDRLVEAYRVWPDSGEGFRFVMSNWHYGDIEASVEDMQPVVDAYRRTAPDDPWLAFYTGELFLRQHKYDEAERHLAEAMQKANDSDRDFFRESRLTALHKSGRTLDAYRIVAPAAETFLDLADKCVEDDEPDLLAQLIAARRVDAPSDVWLDYYEGSRCILAKDFERAKQLLKRGETAATEEYVVSTYRSKRIDAYVAADQILPSYHEFGQDGEIFEHLALHCFYENRWDLLDQLIRRHRRSLSNPLLFPLVGVDERAEMLGVLIDWEVELHWARKDYDKLIDVLVPWPEKPLASLESWDRRDLKLKLTRSLLHVGRMRQARTLAAELREADEFLLPLILVEAASKNVAAATDLAQEYDRREGETNSLYNDEDLKTILFRPEFESFRLAVPPSLGIGSGREHVVVLFSQPQSFDASEIVAKLKADEVEARAEPLPAIAESAEPSTFVVDTDRASALVTFGADAYAPAQHQQEVEDAVLRSQLLQNRGWISIAIHGAGDEKESGLLARRIAAGLLDRASLVYFYDVDRLQLAGESVKQLLLADREPDDVEDYGKSVYMYRYVESEPATVEAARRKMPYFAKAFQRRRPDQVFQVLAENYVGQAEERHWLTVERIAPPGLQSGSSHEIFARLAEDLRLSPQLKAGDLVSIYAVDVLDWKYTDGDKTIHAGDIEDTP